MVPPSPPCPGSSMLDLLPVRSVMGPEPLATGRVLGLLEVPGPGPCTDPAGGAPVAPQLSGCVARITRCLGLSGGTAADRGAERDGVLASPGCCWPQSLRGTQGSKAGEVTAVPAPGPRAGPSTRCGASRAHGAWGSALWGHREPHRLHGGCACSHRSSCCCLRALLGCGCSTRVLASAWLPQPLSPPARHSLPAPARGPPVP